MMLGSDSAHPIDQAGAYATFASGGTYVQPYVVQSVTDASGHSLYSAKPKPRTAFSADIAAHVGYALQSVITSGTGTSAAIGRPAAGKTGTTSGNVSAWFVGYTPQLSTAVAMFRDNNAPLQNIAGYSQIYGGTLPAKMWAAFMKAALLNTPVAPFPVVQLHPVAPSPTPSSPSATPSAPPSSSAPATSAPASSVTSPPVSSAAATPTPTRSASPTAPSPTGPSPTAPGASPAPG
jgi:membrane peptidoglycan carboxypeptidase